MSSVSHESHQARAVKSGFARASPVNHSPGPLLQLREQGKSTACLSAHRIDSFLRPTDKHSTSDIPGTILGGDDLRGTANLLALPCLGATLLETHPTHPTHHHHTRSCALGEPRCQPSCS